MTSVKTNTLKQKNNYRYVLAVLALSVFGLTFALILPKNAAAAINPEYSRLSQAQTKLQTSLPGIVPAKTNTIKQASELTPPVKKMSQINSQTAKIAGQNSLSGSAAGISAQLAPPKGTQKTLPTVTNAPSGRKFIARQNKKKNRWVEVDLSRQKIMLWEGSHLKDAYAVSTGIWGHNTPTGNFYVYLHIRSQTMSGPGYSLPNVQYVQYFYGDYSLHGTWWHNNFGHPMSHGCVNLPTYKAHELWNWSPQRLKVVIHQ